MATTEATSIGAGAVDCRDVPVSYANADAISMLEKAHNEFLAFEGDSLATVNALIDEHPNFMMAQLYKAAYLTQSMETRIFDDMVTAVDAAEALSGSANDRERFHLAAVKAWVRGDFFGAVMQWENALTRYPRDLLALQLIHLTDVLLGDVTGQRDSVARVFNLWNEGVEGYEFVLGFYAFGLLENGDYTRAEEMGRRSLQIRPENPYAIHAVCHVMEMQGRQVGGQRFMYDRVDSWANSNFANHLWWHTALLHLDLQEFDAVLDIYDRHLRSQEPDMHRYEELDAAALLWRLKLVGVDTGERWSELADKWEPAAQDTLYAFNDVHAMMTFVSDNRVEAAKLLLNANERYVESASDANVAATREVGLPFCMAMQDFHDGRYADCVNRLRPIRYRTRYLGGSAAQRDIVGWTLLEAALRDGQFELALALANERAELKPTSPQNWINVARAFEGLGDECRAAKSRARASSLVS